MPETQRARTHGGGGPLVAILRSRSQRVKGQPEIHTVEWRGQLVGTLAIGMIDMGYFDGPFTSNGTEAAARFIELASALDLRTVFADCTKGTRVFLRGADPSESGFDAVVFALKDGQLSLRWVIWKEGIQWLRDNVK